MEITEEKIEKVAESLKHYSGAGIEFKGIARVWSELLTGSPDFALSKEEFDVCMKFATRKEQAECILRKIKAKKLEHDKTEELKKREEDEKLRAAVSKLSTKRSSPKPGSSSIKRK